MQYGGASIVRRPAICVHLIALISIGFALLTCAKAGTGMFGPFERAGRTYENIAVLGTSGSTCTYRRDRQLLATFVLPHVNDRSVALDGPDIDLTDSHADITVVCWQDGQTPVAKVISYGPAYAIVDIMPCFAPPDASEAERRACSAQPGPLYDVWMGYPSVARMPPFDKPRAPP